MTEVTIDIDIDEAVETALDNIDLSDYIDNDEILSQVNNYIDNDDIRYAIEDDILSQVHDYIDIDSIRWDLEGHFADDDDFHTLKDEVQELQEQMEKLLEVIRLPEEPIEHDIYFDMRHIVPLDRLRDTYQERRDERWSTIRYMSKPELVAWCEENDYDVDGMTVKQIHELVL